MRTLQQPSSFIVLAVFNLALSAATAQSNSAAHGAQQPTIRTTTKLVLVDVVVTDHDRAVRGLDRSRFHVFEDGKEQVISSFDEHRAGSTAPAMFSSTGLPPHTYTNAPDPQATAVNVLLFDALNTPTDNQMLVRRKMLDYLATVKPGTPLAIFTLGSKLRMVTSFTTDPASLLALMTKPKTGPQQSPALQPPEETAQAAAAANDLQSMQPQNPAGAQNGAIPVAEHTSGPIDAVDAMQQFESDFTSFQIDYRAKTTLDAMQQLARYLGGIEGRKNVIWFSGSFPFVLLPTATAMPFNNVQNYREQIEKTADVLTAARIAIYAVDANGLWVESQYSAATIGVPHNNQISVQTREDQYGNQATMQEIADQTGGRAYLEDNDIAKAVASAVENGASYYTLAYVPQMSNPNDKLHSIRVKLDDDHGIKLEYRRGYYTAAPQEAAGGDAIQQNSFATAIAPDAPESTEVLLKARVLPASDPACKGMPQAEGRAAGTSPTFKGPPHRFIVDLTIDPHGLAFQTSPNGDRKTSIQLAMVAYGANGERLNYFLNSAELALEAANLDRIMASGITVRLPIDLPAGQVDLRIGVHDLNSDRAGTLDVPLVVQ